MSHPRLVGFALVTCLLVSACDFSGGDAGKEQEATQKDAAPAQPAASTPSPSTPAAAQPSTAPASSLSVAASDSRVFHEAAVATLKDGALVATGKGGMLAYGPYAGMQKGRYLAIFKGSVDTLPTDAAVHVDVVASQGSKVLGKMDVKAPVTEGEIAKFEVTLENDEADVEMRVNVPEGVAMRLTGIELVQH